VWPGIPKSQIPKLPTEQRTTKYTLSSVRNVQNDELDDFLSKDKVSFLNLNELLNQHQKVHPSILTFELDDAIVIRSKQFECGIPKFVIKIFENLNFETYYCGIKCNFPSLSANRIRTLNSWSIFDEIIWFLNTLQPDNKKKQLCSTFLPWDLNALAKKFPLQEMIVRAFTYFATLRALYSQMRTCNFYRQGL